MRCYGCDGAGYISIIDLWSVEITSDFGFEFVDYGEDADLNLSLLAEAYGSDYVEYTEYLLCPWCDGIGKELE